MRQTWSNGAHVNEPLRKGLATTVSIRTCLAANCNLISKFRNRCKLEMDAHDWKCES